MRSTTWPSYFLSSISTLPNPNSILIPKPDTASLSVALYEMSPHSQVRFICRYFHGQYVEDILSGTWNWGIVVSKASCFLLGLIVQVTWGSRNKQATIHNKSMLWLSDYNQLQVCMNTHCSAADTTVCGYLMQCDGHTGNRFSSLSWVPNCTRNNLNWNADPYVTKLLCAARTHFNTYQQQIN